MYTATERRTNSDTAANCWRKIQTTRPHTTTVFLLQVQRLTQCVCECAASENQRYDVIASVRTALSSSCCSAGGGTGVLDCVLRSLPKPSS